MRKLCRSALLCCSILWSLATEAQKNYPQQYFRNPLDIPMQLVANFGELRNNHWHMGLDIRTQQRENLPVMAAADGYIARVSIDATGFGRALVINHPNGLSTLYAHLNAFEPAIEQWVKAEQYKRQQWDVDLEVPRQLFPVSKGQFIAYSGNTGGSQGPHVHFEIRETATGRCLNPMLFGFPIPDAVPPTISRIALYDRNKSTYAQTPQLIGLRKAGATWQPATGNLITAASNKISFAIGAVDRFTGYTNPNGIYCARILMDGMLLSEFELDRIDYDETRYLNASTDYRLKAAGGPWLQHISRMPGDTSQVYQHTPTDGILYLTDTATHQVEIEVSDAAGNHTTVAFAVRYNPAFARNYTAAAEQLVPAQVNILEREDFELYTSEFAVYDTVAVNFTRSWAGTVGGVSPVFSVAAATHPVHDSVQVRIKIPDHLDASQQQRLVIKGVAGSRTVIMPVTIRKGWATAQFRQLGTYQLILDQETPTINAPGSASVVDARKLKRLIFTPRDNLDKIAFFRAEVDGSWLRFTNNKGRTWIYNFDEMFPLGEHTLRVVVRDVAGNETVKEWRIMR